MEKIKLRTINAIKGQIWFETADHRTQSYSKDEVLIRGHRRYRRTYDILWTKNYTDVYNCALYPEIIYSLMDDIQGSKLERHSKIKRLKDLLDTVRDKNSAFIGYDWNKLKEYFRVDESETEKGKSETEKGKSETETGSLKIDVSFYERYIKYLDINDRLNEINLPQILRECRPVYNILKYLAKCDGGIDIIIQQLYEIIDTYNPKDYEFRIIMGNLEVIQRDTNDNRINLIEFALKAVKSGKIPPDEYVDIFSCVYPMSADIFNTEILPNIGEKDENNQGEMTYSYLTVTRAYKNIAEEEKIEYFAKCMNSEDLPPSIKKLILSNTDAYIIKQLHENGKRYNSAMRPYTIYE